MLIKIFKFLYTSFKSWQTEASLNSEINLQWGGVSNGGKGVILMQDPLYVPSSLMVDCNS